MAERNQEDDDVIVTFNGRDHKLKDWAQKETAATDNDPSLNWRKVFDAQSPSKSHAIEEPATTGFSLQKRKKIFKKKMERSVLAPFLKLFWVPFLSAIIVGLGIGFTVLILLSGDDKKDEAGVPAAGQAAPTDNTETPDVKISANDLGLTLQVIQANTFSTKTGAEEQLTKLKDQGIPAAIVEDSGKYSVFIGLAKDEATRDDLVTKYGDLSPYGKSWDLSIKSIKTTEKINKFLETGRALFLAMVPISSSEEVDQKNINAIKQTLDDWASVSSLKAPKTINIYLTSFRGAVESAFSHIENTDDQDTGEQSLLDALSLYQKILVSLQK